MATEETAVDAHPCSRTLLEADAALLAKLSVPVAADEADRLANLRATMLCDSKADPMFDRFCALAKRLFNIPFALINLIEVDRAFVKSQAGMPALALTNMPRDQVFCAYTVQPDSPEVFVVEDTFLDPRFTGYNCVKDPPHIRFYAGVALVINHVRVGSLCIHDLSPKEFGTAERTTLLDIGAAVSSLIEERYRSLQNQSKATAKIMTQMFKNIQSPMSAIAQAANAVLEQQGGGAVAGSTLDADLRESVGRLSLVWEASMTLGAFIADKVESANFLGEGGFRLCDVLSTVKDARTKLERLPAAGGIVWNVNHAVFALAKNHIACPKALFFLLLDYVGHALDAWEEVAVDVHFAANDDRVEHNGVAAQIDTLPETDGDVKWRHGRLEVSIALAKQRERYTAARHAPLYTLAQVLKDVGGAIEETHDGGAGTGAGPDTAMKAAAWMPCAVLIDDAGMAIAAGARPTSMRSSTNLEGDGAPTPPEAAPHVPSLGTAPAAAEAPSPTHRLLLVEDSSSMQQALTRFFSKHGYAVTVATNGREGLERLTTERFDVCFMDFLMPVLTGVQCMAEFAEWRQGAADGDTSRGLNDDMLLIGMSANAVPADLETGYDCGMAFFCPKPVQADMLSFILQTRKKHTLAETIDIISADAKGLYTPRVGPLEELIQEKGADALAQYDAAAVKDDHAAATEAPAEAPTSRTTTTTTTAAPTTWPKGSWRLFRRHKVNAVVPV